MTQGHAGVVQPVQIVVRSLGTAGFAVVKALEPLCPLPGADVARVLYRAPGQLFPSLSPDIARPIADQLEKAGLEIELLPSDEVITPGEGRFDVTLEVRDFSRATDLLRAIHHLLGMSGREARDLLCTSPCQLIGSVSEATVDALRRRFEPLGASIRAAIPRESRYDLYVITGSNHLAQRLIENLAALGYPAEPIAGGQVDLPRRVPGLSWEAAQQVWEQLGRRGDAILLVNRAFERFDVVLDGCEDAAALAAPLVAVTGMPDRVVNRVLERLPVVILNNVSYEQAVQAQRILGDAGGAVHSELLALQSFQVEIPSCARVQETAQVLLWLLDLPLEQTMPRLRNPPYVLPNPLSAMRSRWLHQELTALGTPLKLVKR